MIKYPVKVESDSIVDAVGRVLELSEIVVALNAKGPRPRKPKPEDLLRASDLTAQLVGRDDVEYGHHESLPRGEHVANLKRKVSSSPVE